MAGPRLKQRRPAAALPSQPAPERENAAGNVSSDQQEYIPESKPAKSDPESDSESDSESELLEQLQQIQAQKANKEKESPKQRGALKKLSWRSSRVHKERQTKTLTVANDQVHSDAHRDFLDKFIK